MDLHLLQMYLDIAEKAALAGGYQIQINFGQVKGLREKSYRDPVTQADQDAEKHILQILQHHFPEHYFLSEERGKSGSDSSPLRWIIDPLDGTMNYIHGIAHFGVSIALQHHETTLLGVVYRPLANEMYTALLGHGAFLNGKRLYVSQVRTLTRSLIGTGFSSSLLLREKQLAVLGMVLQVCAAIREPGSAALGLCDVAKGVYEGYWELGLMPWDAAAGALLVTEAGGNVTNSAGGPLDLADGNIVASNGLVHDELLEFMMEKHSQDGV